MTATDYTMRKPLSATSTTVPIFHFLLLLLYCLLTTEASATETEIDSLSNQRILYSRQLRQRQPPMSALRPVVFCGPSGVGKGTLIELLMKRFPNDQFGFSVSHTTRKPREGEVDGVHYNFTTVDAIKKEIADGKFIEYAEVHGKYYGTR